MGHPRDLRRRRRDLLFIINNLMNYTDVSHTYGDQLGPIRDLRRLHPEPREHLPDSANAFSGLAQAFSGCERRSPAVRCVLRLPEAFSGSQRCSPQPQRCSPDPQRCSPDPQRFTTDPQRFTTDPQRFTTNPQRFTTDPQRFTSSHRHEPESQRKHH